MAEPDQIFNWKDTDNRWLENSWPDYLINVLVAPLRYCDKLVHYALAIYICVDVIAHSTIFCAGALQCTR